MGDCGLDHGGHFFLTFAYREATDGVAGKIEVVHEFGGFCAKVCVEAALNDGEEGYGVGVWGGWTGFGFAVFAEFFMLCFAADYPVVSAFHGGLKVWFCAIGGGAFVEGHDDIGAELMLDLDGSFGREVVRGAIKMRFKFNSIVVDLDYSLNLSLFEVLFLFA